MQIEHFQGKDGYVWWNGVVEDRKDPLFLGRCRVRILGWHTENKAELPTDFLPWAQVLMPITSASQTGVGEAPVGPVEGTWVMGFYRDGELAQEPVMVGTLPGIPERFARKNTGFYDSRLDDANIDKNTQTILGEAITSGTPKNLQNFPYPPKSLEYKAGQEATVTNYTHDERVALQSQSLYPREINRPTTSIYARGAADSTTKVIKGTGTTAVDITNTTSVSSGISSIVANKNRNLLSEKISIAFTPNPIVFEVLGDDTPYFSDSASFSATNDSKDINQPPTPYNAVYPFNHVYESESGHLIEVDDTPSKERLHWYHRSGTFTEFHPAGNRTERTVGNRYDMTTGNQETIVRGDDLKVVSQDSFIDMGGKLTVNSGKDMKFISDAGNIILDAPTLNTVISGKNVLIAASDTLVLKGGTKIIRDDASAKDVVKGNYQLNVIGGHELSVGKLSLGSLGATNISSVGPMTQTIAGSSAETIANTDVALGNMNAKLIKAMLGKIVLECLDPVATGGLELNQGPGGAAGQVSIAQLGDITISTKTGPRGITMEAVLGPISITTPMTAELVGVQGVTIGSAATPVVDVKGVSVNVGGSDSPALLAKDFLNLFKDHTHPSPNGPTGPLSPKFAPKLTKTMAKKVFLA